MADPTLRVADERRRSRVTSEDDFLSDRSGRLVTDGDTEGIGRPAVRVGRCMWPAHPAG